MEQVLDTVLWGLLGIFSVMMLSAGLTKPEEPPAIFWGSVALLIFLLRLGLAMGMQITFGGAR